MVISEMIALHIEHGLAPLGKNYAGIVLKEMNEKSDILGPLCSFCENAELTIDLIDPIVNVSWWWLVSCSCRCKATCKEYMTHQIYLNKEGLVTFEDDKERHPSKITCKLACQGFKPLGSQE